VRIIWTRPRVEGIVEYPWAELKCVYCVNIMHEIRETIGD
jgi:hypothetical protein